MQTIQIEAFFYDDQTKTGLKFNFEHQNWQIGTTFPSFSLQTPGYLLTVEIIGHCPIQVSFCSIGYLLLQKLLSNTDKSL